LWNTDSVPLLNQINFTPFGSTLGSDYVWTGTGPLGEGLSNLGTIYVAVGNTGATNSFWVSSPTGPASGDNEYLLYGFSNVLTVPNTVTPEPATITLLGTGLLAFGAFHLRRRRKSSTT
jgi:hypothetical protein